MPVDFPANRYNWPCNAKEDQKEIKRESKSISVQLPWHVCAVTVYMVTAWTGNCTDKMMIYK